jgi:aspartate 1-decarboxylase
VICLKWSSSQLVQPGDKVIIISFGIYSDSELEGYKPIVVNGR